MRVGCPVIAALVVATASCASPSDGPVMLRLDPLVTHQTIEGWGANLPILGIPFDEWVVDPSPARYDQLPLVDPVPDALKTRIIDDAVSDLGLTRFRLEIGPQVEMLNDNADPHHTDDAAYRFRWQDFLIERWLLPLKQRVEARNEAFVLYISYDLRSSLTPEWLLDPEEYAEMAVACLRHFKKAYNLEPDYWVVLNEPGNRRPGDPQLVARLIVATAARIRKEGFRTRLAGPEVVTPAQFSSYMKALDAAGALPLLGQLTYHLYWDPMTVGHRNEIRDWSKRLRVTAAQTEWLEGEGLEALEALYLDLTEADVSAWEQYTLCWTPNTYNSSGGGDYFLIYPGRSTHKMNANARLLRQYMKYIRPGDVRLGISSSRDGIIRPVAFRSPKGGLTIVVINSGRSSEQIRIQPLAPGDYHGSVATEDGDTHALPRQSVEAEGTLSVLMPARGAITFQQVQ